MLAPCGRGGGIEKTASARPVLKGATMNYLALKTGLALLAVVSATGCALAGERVGGVCPAGETCSDQAPDGLFFLGASRADSFGGGVEITAAGGTQTIKVLLGSNTDSPSFDKAFDAATSDAKVATIGSITPPNVVLDGASAGTTSLRLLESGTTKLLDRVDVKVAAIDKVTVFPKELFLVATDDGTPWALLAGSKASMVVQLRSAGGDRLVDEKLTLKPATGAAASQAWDQFEITAPDAGDASFTVDAGKGSFTAKAAVVAAIDAIESSKVLNQLGADGSLPASDGQLLCFLGKSGGVTTAGLTWKFSGSETITITPQDSGVQDQSSCVQLQGTAVGPAKLTVEASGFTKVVDINFVKKASKSARWAQPAFATRPLPAASAGERAGED
jgi:hypothetical protein